MEAIIFFQKKRGLTAPMVEPVGMKSYLLIRVFLNVDEESWFGQSLQAPVKEDAWMSGRGTEAFGDGTGDLAGRRTVYGAEMTKRQAASGKASSDKVSLRFRLRHPFKAHRQRREQLAHLQQECERRLELEKAYARALEAWRQQVEKTCEEVRKLSEEILELTWGCDEISAVYEDSIRKALAGIRKNSGIGKDSQACLSHIWQQNFLVQEFSGFGREFWNLHLLPGRLPHHFVVLGTSGEIFSLLEHCAPGMRSLRWFLLKENCTARLLEFVENFYEEYGLVIELHTFEEAKEMQREGLNCPERACILDFFGEMYLSGADVAGGSIWLDMYASEEKSKKLQRRCPHITYHSLKEKWRKAQKRCNCAVFP